MDIEFHKKNHKRELSSYEINIPPVRYYKDITIQDTIHFGSLAYWIKYKWEDFKKNKHLMEAFEILLDNFSRETVNYDPKNGFEDIWIFFATTLGPNLTITNRYHALGFAGFINNPKDVLVNTLSVAWIHPFLRNQGMMKGLLKKYIETSFFVVDPPVSLAMDNCFRSAVKLVGRKPDKWLQEENKYFFNRFNVDISNLDVGRKQLLYTMIQTCPIEITKEFIEKTIKMMYDEEFLKALENTDIEKLDEKTFTKELNKFSNQALISRQIESEKK